MMHLRALTMLVIAACDVGEESVECESAAAERPNGHHNEGENCMAGNCHGEPRGMDAPGFTAAGTIYTNSSGTRVAPGATVVIGGLTLISADNGNFFTSSPIVFSATTTATSLCLNENAMSTPLADATFGNCNSANCHSDTSTTGRVY